MVKGEFMGKFIEISRAKANELGSVKKAYEQGFFTVWDSDRIKRAFNFGNGTLKDFKNYMENNKNYCLFMEA